MQSSLMEVKLTSYDYGDGDQYRRISCDGLIRCQRRRDP